MLQMKQVYKVSHIIMPCCYLEFNLLFTSHLSSLVPASLCPPHKWLHSGSKSPTVIVMCSCRVTFMLDHLKFPSFNLLVARLYLCVYFYFWNSQDLKRRKNLRPYLRHISLKLCNSKDAL